MTIFERIQRRMNRHFKPAHLRVIASGMLGRSYPKHDDRVHLLASLRWLEAAFQTGGRRGIPASYDFASGWLPSYPETTGYIIDSLLAASDYLGEQAYFDLAIELARWEAEIQLDSGAVRVGSEANDTAFVFDTGMVLLGMCSLYERANQPWIREFILKAASWLVKVQADDGLWPRHCYRDIPHAYHSKVAWALVRAARVLNREPLVDSARKSIRAILALKQPNGWFDLMAFTRHEPPYTHTIAYTLQGFLGVAQESNDPELGRTLIAETREFTSRLLPLFRWDSDLLVFPGEVDANWQGNHSYTCLTGNAQLAGVFLDLHRLFGEDKDRKAAQALMDSVKCSQRVDGPDPVTRGAIAGSFPIWGRYHPFEYPNWAPKFFVDALLKKLASSSRACD